MRPALLLGLVLLAGCPGPLARLTHATPADLPAGAAGFEVRTGDTNGPDGPRVAQAAVRVAPALSRWGQLSTRVTLWVVPDHDALERAVSRRDFPWLKAWARYDAIVLQSPSTWAGPQDTQLDELLLHELTHCLMFQRAATQEQWTQKHIPLWFREGLATVTANQAYRFPTLEGLAGWLDAYPGRDVLGEAETISRTEYEMAYGLAHHAVHFLLRRYGDAAATRTMDAMHAGLDFPQAFEQAVGLPLAAFEREFLNFLKLRGFRGAGRQVGKPPPTLDGLLHRTPKLAP